MGDVAGVAASHAVTTTIAIARNAARNAGRMANRVREDDLPPLDGTSHVVIVLLTVVKKERERK